MKFTPQARLKMADIVQAAANKANGVKKRRLESLAYAHRLRATQLAALAKGMTPDTSSPTK